MSIYIEDYSGKSFVVRGETREFKDILKSMGGKWNSRLTDKSTKEKFGAWLFWSDKRAVIEKWFEEGCPVNYQTASVTPAPKKTTISLEQKVDRLIDLVEMLCKKNGITLGYEEEQSDVIIDSDSDDDMPRVPMRRLLRK